MTPKEFYNDKRKYFETKVYELNRELGWALNDLLSTLTLEQRALLNGYRINDVYHISNVTINGFIYVKLDDYDDNDVQLQSMTINEMLSLLNYIISNILK